MTQPLADHADHFEDARQQTDAARLGVWLLVVSELLLFAGLFALYAVTRASSPEAFEACARHMSKTLGTANTFILLTSSFTAALALSALRAGRTRLSVALIFSTALLACTFLALKGVEYRQHLDAGMGPAMAPRADLPRATALFFTLYFLTTGLHALHVIGGLCAFGWAALGIARKKLRADHSHPLELVTIYWHFVDLVWIFLWPAFYLTGGGR